MEEIFLGILFLGKIVPGINIPQRHFSGIYIPVSSRNIYSWNALSGIFVPGIVIPETRKNIYS